MQEARMTVKGAQRITALIKQSSPQLAVNRQAAGLLTSGGGPPGLAIASSVEVEAPVARQIGLLRCAETPRSGWMATLVLRRGCCRVLTSGALYTHKNGEMRVQRNRRRTARWWFFSFSQRRKEAHAGTMEAGTVSVLCAREGIRYSFSPTAAQPCCDLFQTRGLVGTDTQCKALQPHVSEHVSAHDAAVAGLFRCLVDESHRDVVQILQLHASRASSATDSCDDASQVPRPGPSSAEQYSEDQIRQHQCVARSVDLHSPASRRSARVATRQMSDFEALECAFYKDEPGKYGGAVESFSRV